MNVERGRVNEGTAPEETGRGTHSHRGRGGSRGKRRQPRRAKNGRDVLRVGAGSIGSPEQMALIF